MLCWPTRISSSKTSRKEGKCAGTPLACSKHGEIPAKVCLFQVVTHQLPPPSHRGGQMPPEMVFPPLYQVRNASILASKPDKSQEIQYIDTSVKFCTPGEHPGKMGISPTAAARTWHLKPVTGKCSPTPFSGLRDHWALGDWENSLPASDTSRALGMAGPQASGGCRNIKSCMVEEERMNIMSWWSRTACHWDGLCILMHSW